VAGNCTFEHLGKELERVLLNCFPTMEVGIFIKN